MLSKTKKRFIASRLLVALALIFISCLLLPHLTHSVRVSADPLVACADGNKVTSTTDNCPSFCFDVDGQPYNKDDKTTSAYTCPAPKGGSVGYVRYGGGQTPNTCYQVNGSDNGNGTTFQRVDCNTAFGGRLPNQAEGGANENANAPAESTIDRQESEQTCTGKDFQTCIKENPIIKKVIVPIVNFLTVGVGLVVVAMIIVGGIQYTTAGGDPNKVAGAKSRVVNAGIALVAFIFLFAFLQWLTPGGIF